MEHVLNDSPLSTDRVIKAELFFQYKMGQHEVLQKKTILDAKTWNTFEHNVCAL